MYVYAGKDIYLSLYAFSVDNLCNDDKKCLATHCCRNVRFIKFGRLFFYVLIETRLVVALRIFSKET